MKLKMELLDVETCTTNAKLAVVKGKLWRGLALAMLMNPDTDPRTVMQALRVEWGKQFVLENGKLDKDMGGLVQDALREVFCDLDRVNGGGRK